MHMSIISRFNRVRALTQDPVAIKEAMVGSTVVELAPGESVSLTLELKLKPQPHTLCCVLPWHSRMPSSNANVSVIPVDSFKSIEVSLLTDCPVSLPGELV